MTVRPVDSYLTKSDAIYHFLRRSILTGEVAPSEPLQQRNLAKSLGFSVTPLREALKRLQAEGLVQLESTGTMRVTPLSNKELTDLYALRSYLDPFAARLAAEHATDEQIAALEANASRAEPDSALDQLDVNTEFHLGLYAAAGNQVVEGVCSSLWARTDRYRLVLLEATSDAGEVQKEHLAIARALKARDADMIGRLVLEHTLSAQRQIETAAHLAATESQ